MSYEGKEEEKSLKITKVSNKVNAKIDVYFVIKVGQLYLESNFTSGKNLHLTTDRNQAHRFYADRKRTIDSILHKVHSIKISGLTNVSVMQVVEENAVYEDEFELIPRNSQMNLEMVEIDTDKIREIESYE